MKFVIQRVNEASVKVAGKVVGNINKGLLVFVGFTKSDVGNEHNFVFPANKLLNLRLWDNLSNNTRWRESVKSQNLEILVVSQFTLYAFLKGNKPDFHNALEPDAALKLYNKFVETLKILYVNEKIQTGIFGEKMEVSLINDGPVTINWEYPDVKKEIYSTESENNEKLIELEIKSDECQNENK